MNKVNEDRIKKLTAVLRKLNDEIVTDEVRREAFATSTWRFSAMN